MSQQKKTEMALTRLPRGTTGCRAIQWLSGVVRQERIFTLTGWRREGTEWACLQGGGAVGPQGVRGETQVQLPAALKSFQMRPPADPAARVSRRPELSSAR
jgi:hypothetical protein